MLLASYFGKYRTIVVAVAMFIFLDTGVLGLNFYISSQIATDAVNVNLAGRQRMLSQKVVKALLEYDHAKREGRAGSDALEELQGSVHLFDRTLQAFHTGGYTNDASGNPIYLDPVETEVGRRVVQESLGVWQPIHRAFQLLNNGGAGAEQHRQDLLVTAQAENLTLLRLMNDLTNDLEAVARQKSETLRWIQAIAISLAILNFFLILFHFIGQLRKSDAVAEEARRETAEILATVREGLFLLDANLVIQGQHSESVPQIFGRSALAGESFRLLLSDLVVGREMETTEEYIKLLLNGHVKENLIGTLNPLADIEVNLPDGEGGFQRKHLSFRFNRAIEDGEIRHILVTVLDITETAALRAELENARNHQGLPIDALRKLAHLDGQSLSEFLLQAEESLLSINETLRDEAADPQGYNARLQHCFRLMHRIKGDASALELDQIVAAAHQFESQLQTLQKTDGLRGSDFLPLTLALNEFLGLISELQEIAGLLQTLATPAASTDSEPSLNADLIERLASRIAREQDKSVRVRIDLNAASRFSPAQGAAIQSCVVQLVRNAVVHGIELPEERKAQGKDVTGTLIVRVEPDDDGVRVRVVDDGRGLDLQRLRERALERGLYSAQVLDGFSRTRLMGLIFEPGFSTADETDEHAGRGIGMDLVRNNVNRLGGRIRIASQPQRHCEISFLIPDAALKQPVTAQNLESEEVV